MNKMIDTERNYLMIRAMKQSEEEFSIFFGQSVVALGWSDVDFSILPNDDAVASAVESEYYSDGKCAATSVGRWLAQVRRFKNIKADDRILVPYRGSVCLAAATGTESFNQRDGKSVDLGNQKGVDYVLTPEHKVFSVARGQLSEGLQRRLSVRGNSVADLFEFKDEIDSLFTAEHFDWRARLQRAQVQATEDFKSELLARIRAGKTNLQAGGLGLERLIRDLLELDGYKAEVLPKQTFSSFGDADVQASKADRFRETKLLVQIKHHSGTSDTWAAEQLQEIVKQTPVEYADFSLGVVTTAEASEELKTMCEQNNIVLMDGEDVVEWIFESLASLSSDWKMALGIISVPELALI